MKVRVSVLVLLSFVFTGAALQAEELYATVGYGTDSGSGGVTSSLLIVIDENTGALKRTIGDVGYLVNGMTWDRTTGTLYATTSTMSAQFPDGLITINMQTGQGTPVGSGAGFLVNVPAANSAGELYGWSEDCDCAVRWNKATGVATQFGDGTGTAEQGLAFDNFDVLYLVNDDDGEINSINTATGEATYLRTLGSRAHHGTFHPTTNLYYGIDSTGDSGTQARELVVANVQTGAIVDTIPTVDRLHTLAFAGGPAVPVPSTGVGGLLALMALLGVAGFLVLRPR